MATQIMNFKKLEVVGVNRDEALAKAPFQAVHDCTQAYKAWKKEQTAGITEASIKEFCVSQLAKKTKNAVGVGCFVTLEPAVLDTRERPYKVTNIKRVGSSAPKTAFVWIDDKDGHEVLKVRTKTGKDGKTVRATKGDAFSALKELYSKGEYKGNCHLFSRKEEENPTAIGEARYTPSKGSHAGTYMVFGVEA